MKENIVKKNTQRYYNTLQNSYNLFWMNKRNLAMHYGFWDADTKNLHEALLNENKYIADALKIKQNDKVLDAGCGVGGTSIWIAENYNVNVTGISICDKQIKLANGHAKKRGGVAHYLDFKVMDFCNTNFPNEHFDKIFAEESMCYALDKAEFVKEMYRVLKPGGILVIADAFLDEVVSTEDMPNLEIWLEGWAVPNLPKTKEFISQLNDFGFIVMGDKNMKEQIMPSAKRIFKIGSMFYPFDKACHKLRLLSDETYKSTLACLAQYYLFRNDVMSYRLIKCKKGE